MSREDPSYFKIPKRQGILHERGYLQIKEQKLSCLLLASHKRPRSSRRVWKINIIHVSDSTHRCDVKYQTYLSLQVFNLTISWFPNPILHNLTIFTTQCCPNGTHMPFMNTTHPPHIVTILWK